jgi:serralysin
MEIAMVDVPANTTTTAVLETALLNGDELFGTYSGRIETPGDHDWIRVSLTAGKTYSFYLSAQETGFAGGDSFLSLRNAAGAQVAEADDGGVLNNSYLSFDAITTGTYFIDVSLVSALERGIYSVLMTDSPVGTNAFQTPNDDNTDATALQWLIGGQGDDLLDLDGVGYAALGEQANDSLFGTNGFSDALSGGLGNDGVAAGGGNDVVFGDAGDDLLDGGGDNDQVFGGDGFDDLSGDAGNDRLFGGADDDFLFGGTENDLLNGGTGDDTLNGDDGTDTLIGGIGNDIMRGGTGNDVLTGGSGRDLLTGGTSRDFFDFNSIAESKVGATRDIIQDFVRGTNVTGDEIDLRTIDAKAGIPNDQAFTWIATQAFHKVKGELRYSDLGNTSLVQGDVNGDGKADFEILVKVGALGPGDFLL